MSCLRVRYEGIGVEVAEGLEARQLNPGDRLVNILFSLNVFHQNIGEYPLLSECVSPKVLSQVELAGEPVLRIGGEEWDKLAASLVFPCKVFDFLIWEYLTF